MNAKGTRKALNEAFKQFQRLPDWVSIEIGREQTQWEQEKQPTTWQSSGRPTSTEEVSRSHTVETASLRGCSLMLA